MDYVHSLTVGQASGLIAVGVFIISCSAPLLICVLLLRWHGKELSAATWSVIDRQLQSTLWPTLFNSDSVATRHVDPWITCLVYLRIVLSVLIVLAGVISPLGLGESIVSSGARDVAFEYLPDLSPFGRNMQPRSNLPLSRSCVITGYQCPGAFVPAAQKDLNTSVYSLYPNYTGLGTTKVPENITTMFSSATDGTTVAGFFDIQYRYWKRANHSFYDNNEPFLRGVPRAVDNLILRENLTAVEGLIIDMQSGGIGLRNHTIPTDVNDQGVEWQEDLLWLTSEFACSNLNMSYQGKIAIKDDNSEQFSALNIVDDGAFAHLQPGTPYTDWPVINRTDPNLGLRVSRSARLHNTLVAMNLNLTSPKLINSTLNTTIGRSWALDPTTSQARNLNPFAISTQTITDEKSLLSMPYVSYNATTNSLYLYNATANKTVYFSPARDYPYLYASMLFSELEGRCQGHYDDFTLRRDYNVECFLFHETPIRMDGGSPLEHEAGSEWKLPMHMCASAVKASVKTVTLSRNKTSTLSGLVVKNVTDKVYRSPQDYPLWAIEDWNRNGSKGAGLAPIWGLVANSYFGTPGYNFTRSPEFYLPFSNPYSTWTGYYSGPVDSLAGSVVPYGVLAQVYQDAFDATSYSTSQTLARYSGADSAALAQKWEELCKTDRGIEQILRLVWTNIIAGSITSSRGRTSSSAFHNNKGDGSTIAKRADGNAANNNADALRTANVTVYHRRLTYDWRFGAPALILIALWLGLWITSFLFALFCRLRPAHMTHMLRDTSLGRLAARQATATTTSTTSSGGGGGPGHHQLSRVSTSQWLRDAGHVKIPLGHSRRGSMLSVVVHKGTDDSRGSYELTRVEEHVGVKGASDNGHGSDGSNSGGVVMADYKLAPVYSVSSTTSKERMSSSSTSTSTYRLLDGDTAYHGGRYG